MSKDIMFRDLSGRVPVSPGVARRLHQEEQKIAARAAVANLEDIAQAMVTEAAVRRHVGIAQSVRAAIDEEILNIGTLELLDAYKAGAKARIERLS